MYKGPSNLVLALIKHFDEIVRAIRYLWGGLVRARWSKKQIIKYINNNINNNNNNNNNNNII